MTYHHITPLEERCSEHRRYDDPEGIELTQPRDSFLQWPPEIPFEKFKLDAALLKEALSSCPSQQDGTLAKQVFGSQARQQKISLGHLANILYERALLHRNRLRDIDWHLTECQDRLSVLKMNFPMDGGKTQQHLEKLIIDLEKQRHDEEASFWKDSAEVRQQLFENAAIYGAAKRRQDMLYGVEAQ